LLIIQQYDPNREELVTSCQIVSSSIVAEMDDSGNIVQEDEPADVAAYAESDSCDSMGNTGASAKIQKVQIGSVTGEYVAGGWVPAADVTPLHYAEPGETVTYESVWDPNAPEHRLRWEEDGIAYDILAQGEGLTMEDIILIAESMQ